MPSQNAGALADTAVRLHLLTHPQADEVLRELGSRDAPAEDCLRCAERKGFLTPFQTNKLLKGETDGYFLGGYRLLYKVSSGSFGRVYRAVDPNTGRIVAMKVLRKKWTEDRHKIELFLREGKMGMNLRHPNIVEILAVNQDKKTGQYYIVMEFVEGTNLKDFLNVRKKLQGNEVLRILEESASGLAHAFANGMTHRDIKLSNILLSSQGPAKLVDFGLAGEQFAASEDKEDVNVDRTVDYAGLEKATDAPHGDPRSDIFFLGCVAFELLTGRSPLAMEHSQRSASARMNAQRFAKIAPILPEEVQAPASLLQLIESMMAVKLDQRIQTAAQLVERVRACRAEIEGLPSEAGRGASTKQATIFLVESDEKLQDLLRAKLKEQGYRILIAADPVRALDRFRQQPFDLLIVDASTTGENGFYVFERVMDDVRRQAIPCSGILMLTTEQAPWKERVAEYAGVVTLVQPIKYKQLLQAIRSVLGGSAS